MKEEIKITILGDICSTNDYRSLFDSKNPTKVFGDVLNILNESDLAIANLEAPATEINTPIIKTGPSLKVKPSDIKLLKEANINVLSLANNHILDYGVQGVNDTLSICENLNIKTVGGGKNKKDAKKPLLVTVKTKVIGILSFAEAEFNLATENAPGANHFDPLESIREIEAAKSHCDYLIVLYHGGIEHYIYPSPLLQKKCRYIAQAGADIVLCQHSHCIGTLEEYQGSTILYGQGNSVFGYRKEDASWNEGLIVEVVFDSENEDKPQVSFSLIKATKDGISLANSGETEERLKRIYEQSLVLTDDLTMQKLWEEFSLNKASLYLPLLYGKGRIFNKLNRILSNQIIKTRFSNRAFITSLNLIRCEAHNEVLESMLKQITKKK